MSFYNEFAKNFTEEGKRTELFNLWSAIGQNMEKAIIEEQNKINAEHSDINVFNENTLRSWLAFFLYNINYKESCTCLINIKNNSGAAVSIPENSQLITSDGIKYVMLKSVTLSANSTVSVEVVQGEFVQSNETFSSLIKIKCENPNLRYMTVKVDGNEINRVSYLNSYDQFHYMGSWSPASNEVPSANPNKGDVYNLSKNATVTIDSVQYRYGDLICYDGSNWRKLDTSINFALFSGDTTVPTNGYFAYYYDGNLYVKIFTGDDVSIGSNVSISWIKSDSTEGQISSNAGFSFVNQLRDVQNRNANITITNETSSTVPPETNIETLRTYQKQALFVNNTISSVPEYQYWLSCQPEIADVRVLSDWEISKIIKTYRNTQIVRFYALDNNGDKIYDNATAQSVMERMKKYSDIAYTIFSDFIICKHYFIIRYTSATNEQNASSDLINLISNEYDIHTISQHDSLFDNFDISKFMITIDNKLSSQNFTGLSITGYHYERSDVMSYTASNLRLTKFSNEKFGVGNFYRFYKLSDQSVTPTDYIELYEDANGRIVMNGVTVGMSTQSEVTFYNLELANASGESTSKFFMIEAFWQPINQAILTNGIKNESDIISVRKLADAISHENGVETHRMDEYGNE